MSISHSQNDISISLAEKPTNALSDPEHYYLIELNNNSAKQFENLNISIINVSCKDDSGSSKFYKDHSKTNNGSKERKDGKNGYSGSNLDVSVLKKDKVTTIQNLNLNGRSTVVFNIKYARNQSTKLNTANCFEIVVKSSDNEKELSNKLIIEQLIPDPNDFD